MGWQIELRHATKMYREAEGHLTRAERLLAEQVAAVPSPQSSAAEQARLAQTLSHSAATLAPGLLSADLQNLPAQTLSPPTTAPEPVYVRVGTTHPLPRATFPALVPLLGSGHLVIDGDASDPRVAGMLQSLLVRVMGSVPRLKVSLIDCVTLGQTFSHSAGLVGGPISSPPATDAAGVARILDAAETQLQEAHQARNSHDTTGLEYHLIVVAGLPAHTPHSIKARIAALAHAGPHGFTHLVLAGWRGSAREPAPAIEHGTYITLDAAQPHHHMHGMPAPISLDPPPPPHIVSPLYRQLSTAHEKETNVELPGVLPTQTWTESSTDRLTTVVGRDRRGAVTLSFDDATPHWLLGGRTGGGKTVFLLDVLYGLAARYAPTELAMYLLDFKEGVSFTEFSPSAHDETWIPHVRAVGVESDREYGNAVLKELRNEMTRRATAMKRAGVTKLADLRSARPDARLPRVLAVIDEFHVLFQGNDKLARQAAGHLEELARKGRSYGIHLVLASQTIAGVEALFTKKDSIFGQFPMRIALPGAKHVLAPLNTAADSIRLGQAVVNDSGGVAGEDRLIQFPDATADTALLSQLRHDLWRRRNPDASPPAVFAGYAQQHLEDDPTFRSLHTDTRHPRALIGRAVDVGISTTSFALDPVPGRHIAVLGTSKTAAEVIHAATVSLARQHQPGRARFILAPLVSAADTAADETSDWLKAEGHDVDIIASATVADTISELHAPPKDDVARYLVLFGGDTIAPALGAGGLQQLRAILKHGPSMGVYLVGWWRGLGQFIKDIGGTSAKEDVACLVALNIPGSELGPFINDVSNEYVPNDNRALVVDRHANTVSLCVPFTRPESHDAEGIA